MKLYLAITPKEAQQLSDCSLPRVHIAYAVDDGGMLTRSTPPEKMHGGLMGLSDRCSKPLPRTDALLRTIVSECAARQFAGVFADFESSPFPDRITFLERLGTLLRSHGKVLYAPQIFPVSSANVLISTAISGGSLREMLQSAQDRYGQKRIALDLQRLIMDFPLPCMSGQGRPMTLDELNTLRRRRDISAFYSRELGAQYFTHTVNGEAHFVLFDDAQTIRQKLALGEKLGIETAFLMYPEVRDLLPQLAVRIS